MGVNSLPKTVTRQRRDCDLNRGPSAPESSTVTTQLYTASPIYVCMCVYYMRLCSGVLYGIAPPLPSPVRSAKIHVNKSRPTYVAMRPLASGYCSRLLELTRVHRRRAPSTVCLSVCQRRETMSDECFRWTRRCLVSFISTTTKQAIIQRL